MCKHRHVQFVVGTEHTHTHTLYYNTSERALRFPKPRAKSPGRLSFFFLFFFFHATRPAAHVSSSSSGVRGARSRDHRAASKIIFLRLRVSPGNDATVARTPLLYLLLRDACRSSACPFHFGKLRTDASHSPGSLKMGPGSDRWLFINTVSSAADPRARQGRIYFIP